MEAVEFYIMDGSVRYRCGGTDKKLGQADRDVVTAVLDGVRRFFPAAHQRLQELFRESERNRHFYEYRMAERFIRCNFGEYNRLEMDLENGMFHFEEVSCPLRGVCKDEGVVCKPRFAMQAPSEEIRVARLYSRGHAPKEIAGMLKKSVKTVKNQLARLTKRLHLNGTRDLIRVLGSYPVMRYLEQ